MLPLLDYSTKKAQMLHEYHAQLEPQLTQGEPWTDAHMWAILSGEIEVLLRDTLQLYTDLVRMDELHHYHARTQPQYPYAQVEEAIEALLRQLRDLLVKGTVIAAAVEHHGYPPKGAADIAQCLQALEVLLADESPIYTSEPFQAVLQQSLDDINAGRVVEMTPEQL
jgi:hypothetical protein